MPEMKDEVIERYYELYDRNQISLRLALDKVYQEGCAAQRIVNMVDSITEAAVRNCFCSTRRRHF
jgi:hypothetical protein